MQTPLSAANSAPTHELRKHIKKRDCIYAISETAENPDILFDSILQNLVLLLGAVQFDEFQRKEVV